MQHALINFKAHIAGSWREDLALVIDDGLIAEFVDTRSLSPTLSTEDCRGGVLAPGFIDTQVNGGGGVMFNQAPTLETLDTMRRGHWSGGTTAMLPTLITDADDVMTAAVESVASALDTLPGILGIHLEGPHLATARKGVHSEEYIRPFSEHTEALLALMPAQHYLLTVAPENMPPSMIGVLAARGIRVSAGHTAASYATTRAALDEGMCCFTHLHNAMSPLTGREPGVVGAALEDTGSYMGLIVDGFHLHPTTAKLSVQTKARGKSLLVTDAMSTVGSNAEQFELYGETIYVVDGRCCTAEGTLAGSALDMAGAVRNTVHTLGIALDEALRMAGQYPAEFMAVDNCRGHLRSGYRADIALLDDDLHLQATWLGGECVYRR